MSDKVHFMVIAPDIELVVVPLGLMDIVSRQWMIVSQVSAQHSTCKWHCSCPRWESVGYHHSGCSHLCTLLVVPEDHFDIYYSWHWGSHHQLCWQSHTDRHALMDTPYNCLAQACTEYDCFHGYIENSYHFIQFTYDYVSLHHIYKTLWLCYHRVSQQCATW